MNDPNPYPHENAPVKSTEDARQGRTRGTVRYILGISLALVVVGMIIVYAIWT